MRPACRFAAVTAATCLSAAVGSFLMGVFARYPIALAPGMGLNAYFTYAVVKGMGVPWQTALGAVFISGVAFLLLTLVGIRQLIVSAIPFELYSAVAAGIGLFIAFIGLRNSGIIVPNPATTVTLGDLRDPSTALALFGLLLIATLLAWRVRAAMLIGILATTVIGLASGAGPLDAAHLPVQRYLRNRVPSRYRRRAQARASSKSSSSSCSSTCSITSARWSRWARRPACSTRPIRSRGINRILLTDAPATIIGAFAGTSTVVSYIESAAGVAAGGRSGVTAIVTGLLFLVALFMAPVVGAIPACRHRAGADHRRQPDGLRGRRDRVGRSGGGDPGLPDDDDHPADVQHRQRAGIRLHRLHAAEGLCAASIREVNWFVYVLTALFIARFVYLAG